MKYFQKLALGFIILLFASVLYLAFSEGFTNLFVFPLLIISGYVIYYLHTQFEKDEQRQVEKQIKLDKEDIDAEQWIKNTFVPETISYGKKKRWVMISYGFFFIAGIFFLWSFISNGFEIALRNLVIASVCFWLFIVYISLSQSFFKKLNTFLPKSLHKYTSGDWGHAFIFLLPIAFLVYVIYPGDLGVENVKTKLLSFPVFIVVYTFAFLGIYSMIYLWRDSEKEAKKNLEKEVKEIL